MAGDRASLVTGCGLETAPSKLDASLWLAAHENYELCAVAGLRAQGLVRDDQPSPQSQDVQAAAKSACALG
jgi:hypothetical protein